MSSPEKSAKRFRFEPPSPSRGATGASPGTSSSGSPSPSPSRVAHLLLRGFPALPPRSSWAGRSPSDSLHLSPLSSGHSSGRFQGHSPMRAPPNSPGYLSLDDSPAERAAFYLSSSDESFEGAEYSNDYRIPVGYESSDSGSSPRQSIQGQPDQGQLYLAQALAQPQPTQFGAWPPPQQSVSGPFRSSGHRQDTRYHPYDVTVGRPVQRDLKEQRMLEIQQLTSQLEGIELSDDEDQPRYGQPKGTMYQW